MAAADAEAEVPREKYELIRDIITLMKQ